MDGSQLGIDLVKISINGDWGLFQVISRSPERIIIAPIDHRMDESALILLGDEWKVEQAESEPYHITFGHLPEYLAHVTSLDSLYKILSSGQLLSRSITGSGRGFSSVGAGDPNYVYLSLNVQDPLIGKVKLVFSSQILLDRSDYFLNTDWKYGVTPESRTRNQLIEWLDQVRGPGEILFPDVIDINPYLKEIVVPQLKPELVQIIRSSDPTVKLDLLNIDQVPEQYRSIVRVVY